jgi:hypothetical protein
VLDQDDDDDDEGAHGEDYDGENREEDRHGDEEDEEEGEEQDDESLEEEQQAEAPKQLREKQRRENSALERMIMMTQGELPIDIKSKVDDFVNKEAWNFIKMVSGKNFKPGTFLMDKFFASSQIPKRTFALYGVKIVQRMNKKFTDKRNQAVSDMRSVFEVMMKKEGSGK